MELQSAVGSFVLSLFLLWNVCESVETQLEASETVINLLKILNQSQPGISRVKGLDPDTMAWRLRSTAPQLTLPQEDTDYLVNSSLGVLGLHLVGRQSRSTTGTIISITSTVCQQNGQRPLLELVSNTRDDWLQLEFRSADGLRPEVMRLPGKNPFTRGEWVRMALSVEPRQVLLYVDCEEVVVLKLRGGRQMLSLELPQDLQVTFASTAGNKAKFTGSWQTADLSTRVYDRRPWTCENITDSLQDVATTTPAPTVPDMMDDEAQRGDGILDATRDSEIRLDQMEDNLHSIMNILDQLRKQNTELQARLNNLERRDRVRRKCLWEGREMEDGSSWSSDSRTVCYCSDGLVQCNGTTECVFHGNIYNKGDVFNPDDWNRCTCEYGRVECEVNTCPSQACEGQPVRQGTCNPACQTRGCQYEGQFYDNGAEFVSRLNPCQRCRCLNSQVSCDPIQCPQASCPNPYRRPGECCPTCSACIVDGRPYNGSFSTVDGCQTCTCQGGNQACVDVQQCPQTCQNGVRAPFGSCCRDCSRCDVNGQVVQDGVSFQTDPCNKCVCNGGNVVCRPESCPDLSCRQTETVSGQCCPRCQSCLQDNVRHLHGSQWINPNDPCSTCTCTEGQVRCERNRCNVPCSNPVAAPPVCDGCNRNIQNPVIQDPRQCENANTNCAQYNCPQTSCSQPVQRPGDCCARCEECQYEEDVYADGATFASKQDPCMSCQCSGGQVSCEPTRSSCPSPRCTHPTRPQNQCCPTCNTCEYEGRIYQDGEEFRPPGSGPCILCTCSAGNVRCHQEQCPALSCAYPTPAPPSSCCPVCKGCMWNNNQYDEGASWNDANQRCSCLDGEVTCRQTYDVFDVSRNLGPNRQTVSEGCGRCQYKEHFYENGQKFEDPEDRCVTCTCQDAQTMCGMQQCQETKCSNPYTPPGECCPRCPDCEYNNRVIAYGVSFPNPVNQCQDCVCADGQVKCGSHDCPAALCSYPRAGSCCKNNCNGCTYAGIEYLNGVEFPHPVDKCRACRCTNGNVQCLMKRCPAVTCAEPYLPPGECCPQCPVSLGECFVEGQVYRHLEQFYHPTDKCQTCSCFSGSPSCRRRPCPSAPCSHPMILDCCRTCDGCLFEGAEYSNGGVFPDPSDPCSTCVCRDGTVTCDRTPCQRVSCPFPVQGKCCPQCSGCQYEGQAYVDGEAFTSPLSSCEQCRCFRGDVRCSSVVCPSVSCPHPERGPCGCLVCQNCHYASRNWANGEQFTDPSNPCQTCICMHGSVSCRPVSCPQLPCQYPIRVPGECCPVCPGGTCDYYGQVYQAGETFTPVQDRCSTCLCQHGSVSCRPVSCPQLPCQYPIRVPGECCPVCPGGTCDYYGQVYQAGETFIPVQDRCSTCLCQGGMVRCEKKPCPQQCTHPLRFRQCCPVCDGCLFEGKRYRNMQLITDTENSCRSCVCQSGSVTCVPIPCPQMSCQNPEECKGCVHEGIEYNEGSTWSLSGSPCTSCMCVNGVTTCSEVHCLSTCANQISLPGECCPVCADCMHEGNVYGPGDSFHPSADPCQICTCEVMPNGHPHLRCYRKQCPSLVDCPKDSIVKSDSCCPVCAQPLRNCTAQLIGNEVLATNDPCFTCQCKDLTWTCMHRGCPPLSCPLSDQYTPPDACCPICDECVLEDDNTHVSNGQTWTDRENECNTCVCNNGHIECELQECLPLDCPHGSIKVTNPGKCCPECTSVTTVLFTKDSHRQCEYEGQLYRHNEHWEVDDCTSCTCMSGEVYCKTKRCPPLTCASDERPAVVPGVCCPRCVSHPATCVVFGDPHYRTFDGQMVDFQGTCSYVLAQDCDGGDFSVHVSNKDRGRARVSWTKEVTVFIGEVVVQLFQDWIVKVNYQTVSLPFLKEPYISLEHKSNTVLLNTNIGLKVLWNGRSHLEVSVPGTYKNRMCGLCGNFNNYPQDDMKLRNGQMARSAAEFGNNWKVENQGAQCLDAKNVDPCKEVSVSARRTANSRCKVLKTVFEPCHRVVPPQMFFEACTYDLCACGSNTEECLCDVLEAYASQCRKAGVIVKWRSSSLCAVGCPRERGYVFDECGPPCPKTCLNKDVPLGVMEAHCFKPCVPGCQCPAGLVEHNGHCIAPEKCPQTIHSSL